MEVKKGDIFESTDTRRPRRRIRVLDIQPYEVEYDYGDRREWVVEDFAVCKVHVIGTKFDRESQLPTTAIRVRNLNPKNHWRRVG